MSSCCSCSSQHDPLQFKLDDYKLPSVASKISPEENEFRHEIMWKILRGEKVQADERIKDLEARNILSTEDDLVVCAYPVSAKSSEKQVHMDDQSYSAMCAIDAIGFAFTFGREVEVEAPLHDTKQMIRLRVPAEGKAPIEVLEGPEDVVVLYPDLRACNQWSGHCCLHMHFFSNGDALKNYIEEQGLQKADILALNLEQALTVAGWIFGEN